MKVTLNGKYKVVVPNCKAITNVRIENDEIIIEMFNDLSEMQLDTKYFDFDYVVEELRRGGAKW